MGSESQTFSPPEPAVRARRPWLAVSVVLDLAYLALVSPLTIWALLGMVTRGKYRRSFLRRWGMGLARATGDPRGPTVWIHAVSVGETRAAAPVVRELRARFPDHTVVVTTATETGNDTARELFADGLVWWSPWDMAWNVARWFRRVRPALLIIMENDVWPNMVRLAARRGVPVAMINGKLSDRSSRRYDRLRRSGLGWLVGAMWRRIDALCVQTDLDRERLARLVRDPGRVHVTGNVKFDFPAPEVTDGERRSIRERLSIRPDDLVIVVGSTHETEEELAGEVLGHLRREQESERLHMILVPRHPERFDEVAELVGKWEVSSQRWTRPVGEPVLVTVVDEMRLLLRLYAVATVAVVGGSFVKHVGGHNILEPAVFGVPVVFGPHMHAQRGMRDVILEADGGIQIQDEREMKEGLIRALNLLLSDPEERRRMGENARRAVVRSRGSAARSVEVITPLVRGSRDSHR